MKYPAQEENIQPISWKEILVSKPIRIYNKNLWIVFYNVWAC